MKILNEEKSILKIKKSPFHQIHVKKPQQQKKQNVHLQNGKSVENLSQKAHRNGGGKVAFSILIAQYAADVKEVASALLLWLHTIDHKYQ